MSDIASRVRQVEGLASDLRGRLDSLEDAFAQHIHVHGCSPRNIGEWKPGHQRHPSEPIPGDEAGFEHAGGKYGDEIAPDQPGGDEAAVGALVASVEPHILEVLGYMTRLHILRKVARQHLAVIRKGEVPGIHDGAPRIMGYDEAMREKDAEIAALRDQLRAANTGREAASEEYRSQIATLRAEMEALRRRKVKLPKIVAACSMRALDDAYPAHAVVEAIRAAGMEVAE